MKYAQWNELLLDYYFLEDKGHEVFLGLDKDSLVDYVIDKGYFDDEIKRVQAAAPNRIIDPEAYIWLNFTRIFRDSKGNSCKDSLLSLFRENLANSFSPDRTPTVFPFIALLTIPLSNNPEMDPRNFYTRVNQFLVSNGLIKPYESIGTNDMRQFERPSLKTMWENLSIWANSEGYHYAVKASTESGHKYVGPFMAESLLTATQRDKYKYIFYFAGLTPEQEISDERIVSILNEHHRHIGYTDDTAWKKQFGVYQDIFIAEFKRQYEKWDGNTVIRQRSGNHKLSTDIGSFRKLYIHLTVFRNNYIFALIPRFNDAEVGAEYSYLCQDGSEYSFGITVDGFANLQLRSSSIAQSVESSTPIVLKDKSNNKNFLKYVNEDFFLFEQHYNAFISGAKLRLGGKFYVLVKKDKLSVFQDWLYENGATEITVKNDFSSIYSLFFIGCAKTPLVSHTSLDCSEKVSAELTSTFILSKDKDSISVYQGLPIYFKIDGVDISSDRIYAVFNIGVRLENRALAYDEERGLWALPPVSSALLADTPFTLYRNDVQISSQQYKAIDFKQLGDDEYDEIAFDRWGDYSEDSEPLIKGLAINTVHSTAFILGDHMAKFGKEPVIKQIQYLGSDYLLYWLSSRPRTDKQSYKDSLAVLLAKNPEEIKYKITSVLDNYFRLGYINYAFHDGKHIIAVNKPSLILIPSGASSIHEPGGLTKIECTDKKWKALLTGARTPQFVDKLLRQAQGFRFQGDSLKVQIDEAINPLYPQRIMFWASSKNTIREFALKYHLGFQASIYANTLLSELGSVQDYFEHTINCNQLKYKSYESINDRRVVDYKKLEEFMNSQSRIRYDSGITTSFTEDKSVVTYYPQKFNEQTVLWYKGEQYSVDKYWGHFIGAMLLGAKVARVTDTRTHILLPQPIKLPILYARAFTLMSAEIPDNQNGRRFYQLCENPFANALSYSKILEKLNQNI